MKVAAIENIVWKEDNHFVAQCLNIDISSFGETKEEALSNLQEAIELYLEDSPSAEIPNIQQPEIVHSKVKYA